MKTPSVFRFGPAFALALALALAPSMTACGDADEPDIELLRETEGIEAEDRLATVDESEGGAPSGADDDPGSCESLPGGWDCNHTVACIAEGTEVYCQTSNGKCYTPPECERKRPLTARMAVAR